MTKVIGEVGIDSTLGDIILCVENHSLIATLYNTSRKIKIDNHNDTNLLSLKLCKETTIYILNNYIARCCGGF